MKRHITPSFVISCVALFVALGGSSYAAVKLNANSVGSREIKNRSVKLADLDPTIRPSKSSKLFRTAVADTLTTDQVLGALSSAVEGDPGAPGATGSTGAQGPAGPAAITVRTADGNEIQVGQGGSSSAAATCHAGEKVVGGGGVFAGTPQDGGILTLSEPDTSSPQAQAWIVNFSLPSFAQGHARAFAVCAA